MIVVADEVSDLLFKVTRQVIVLEQDTVLEGLVPALDLALGLRMHRSTTHMIHALDLVMRASVTHVQNIGAQALYRDACNMAGTKNRGSRDSGRQSPGGSPQFRLCLLTDIEIVQQVTEISDGFGELGGGWFGQGRMVGSPELELKATGNKPEFEQRNRGCSQKTIRLALQSKH